VSEQPLRVLIADDEMLARKRLSRLLTALASEGSIEIAGECADGSEVLDRVKSGGVDVVLLDIHMPNLSGMDAIQLLPNPGPYVIFCTAHSDRAVQAFEVGAVDYLLKPIEAGRLQKALDRARARREAGANPSSTSSSTNVVANMVSASANATDAASDPQRLPVPTRQGIVLIDPEQITHASIDGELVTVHTLQQGELLTDFTLRELEERLPVGRFTRVHRRALLNLKHVQRLEPLETGGYLARTVKGVSVEVSRQAARDLRKRLGLRKPPGEDEE
jgi:two-component system LytT family response regulator